VFPSPLTSKERIDGVITWIDNLLLQYLEWCFCWNDSVVLGQRVHGILERPMISGERRTLAPLGLIVVTLFPLFHLVDHTYTQRTTIVTAHHYCDAHRPLASNAGFHMPHGAGSAAEILDDA